MRHGLGKAKARIDKKSLTGNANLLAGGDTLTQKIDHVGGNIPITGIILHVAGLTLHMHQTDR